MNKIYTKKSTKAVVATITFLAVLFIALYSTPAKVVVADEMYLPTMPACSGSFGTTYGVLPYRAKALFGTGSHFGSLPENYSFSGWTKNSNTTAGNTLDSNWVAMSYPAYHQWDLGKLANSLRVYPSLNHKPYIQTINNYNVYVSTTGRNWVLIYPTAIYINDVKNIQAHDGVKDYYSTEPFRYVLIQGTGQGGALDHYEIDAIQECGLDVAVNIVCNTNTDCGTNSLTGGPFCQGRRIYQNSTTYTCQNPGTTSAICISSNVPQLQKTCVGSEVCYSGRCIFIDP